MDKDVIVIAGIARTPLGNFGGSLSSITSPHLGAEVLRAASKRANIKLNQISEVIMGCVLPAGVGQAPARQAALHAGIPVSIPCTTINKVCGSGMKSIMQGFDSLVAGSSDYVIAGGMENMSLAPYLLPGARNGYRLGDNAVLDHILIDGLEDAWKGKSMGYYAEQCASSFNFSREEQDAYALTSLERARIAIKENLFQAEITPVAGINTDERPNSVIAEKIPKLKPAFLEGGTVTAANSSSISDGAAAIVLARAQTAADEQINLIAKIIAHTTHANAPDAFTTAPIGAIEKLLDKIGWDIESIDLFEINEAFAVVPMAAMKILKIPHEKLNIHGGACALGHPIGASGSRIVVTLVAALKQHGLKRGIAAICIGGGEATALAIEIP